MSYSISTLLLRNLSDVFGEDACLNDHRGRAVGQFRGIGS